jgi:hypothetical protein
VRRGTAASGAAHLQRGRAPALEGVRFAASNRRRASDSDLADLPAARPVDPRGGPRIFKIDSTYEKAGYYLARVRAESTVVSEDNIGITLSSKKAVAWRCPACA